MCRIKNLCRLLLIRWGRGLERGLGTFCRREYAAPRPPHISRRSSHSPPPRYAALRFASFTDSQDADGDAAPQGGEPTYIDQIYSLRDYGKTTLFVDFTHLLRHEEVLARAVADQYYR